jgi:hypothetical protein
MELRVNVGTISHCLMFTHPSPAHFHPPRLGHLLVLHVILHHHISLFQVPVLSAFIQLLGISGRISHKVPHIQQGGSIKRVAQLTLQLLTIKHVPNFFGHLPV